MAPCIKNRIQDLIGTLIIILSTQLVSSQPRFLEAEIGVNSGFKSNRIRVIQKDEANRIWLGTDNGLQIINDQDSLFENLISSIGDKPIWALAFSKSYAFIGTRFDGVYIFNLKLNQITQHFDSAQIGLVRKFRTLDDTVYVATNGNPLYFYFKYGEWAVNKINGQIPNGFITDFAKWEQNIYASVFAARNNELRIIKGGQIQAAKDITFTYQVNKVRNSLSLASDRSKLFIGGDGFYAVAEKNHPVQVNPLTFLSTKKDYPVWDATFIDSRPVFTGGNPDNLQEGMVFMHPSNKLEEVHPNFYGQCLYFDSIAHSLWIGTLNSGLYYWPYAEFTNPTGILDNLEYKVKPLSKDSVLLFNKEQVILKDFKTGIVKPLFHIPSHDNSWTEIKDLAIDGDRIFILNGENLDLIDLKKKKVSRIKGIQKFGIYNRLYLAEKFLYLFAMYSDDIIKIDLLSIKRYHLKATSNQVMFSSNVGNKLIYHSANFGFHLLDSVSHPLNLNFPSIESFTVVNDTMWILNAGKIHIYRINLNNYTLIPLFENNLAKMIPSFMPTWIINIDNNIYCGNHQGFLVLDHQRGDPKSYIYLGNFSRGGTPANYENYIFLNNQNYITRLNDEVIRSQSLPIKQIGTVIPATDISEYNPFSIKLKSNQFINTQHSLKRIEVWKSDRMLKEWYTLTDEIEFTSGLKSGNFQIRIYSNNVLIDKINLYITLPLTSNPYFYLVITIAMLSFALVLFKFYVNKWTYERDMLENRLQILKQNLNPHFIFNSLNLIYSLVLQKKNQAAIKTITSFSDLHRYFLDNINKSEIQLQKELLFIESYLNLEAERFIIDDRIEYKITTPLSHEILECKVPPMILQPLVENAIKHSGSNGGKRNIWIDIHLADDLLVIGIENSRPSEKEKNNTDGGLGLKLIQERVDIYNKTKNVQIRFSPSCAPLHIEHAYRCELIFQNPQIQYKQ